MRNKPNFVVIMTDTQNQDMVGAYGNPAMDTPNLDSLARDATLFTRAYTSCPLCTPARSGIFSGLHPEVNGAWANSMAPGTNIPLMGEIFRKPGYRTAYTGKWHLDGTSYFGDGVAGGGFPQEWWYDGKCYADDLGEESFEHYRTIRSVEDLEKQGFNEDRIWGHRVADRAINFLESDHGDSPFLLVVSFDEPHGPFVAPPEYWRRFSVEDIPWRETIAAPLENKPQLQESGRYFHDQEAWESYREYITRHYGCNSYIDREIGRVLDVVNDRFSEDTVVIYTSDHGDMMGCYGLVGKGPMMYEETTKIPFIVKIPGIDPSKQEKLASHLDIIPTMLDLCGQPIPEILHGQSLKPLLVEGTDNSTQRAFLGFTRFALNHDAWGGFYPIRCIVSKRYKLSINLFDKDELYDLESDPHERRNLIESKETASVRNALHDQIIAHMNEIRDPFRGVDWENRSWRTAKARSYKKGERRSRPRVFPFQATCIEADGAVRGR